MDAKQIRQINVERLGNWTYKMVSSHATPMILIGIGHDHVAGQKVICMLEDMKDDTAAGLLLDVAQRLGEQTGYTVVPKEQFDSVMFLVSFLGILVHRAGGEMTIENLSQVAGTFFEVRMKLEHEQDRVRLATGVKSMEEGR